MLCVYQAVRDLLTNAARAPGLHPARISFKHAAEAARDWATRAALPPDQLSVVEAHLYAQLVRSDHLVAERPPRQAPRARKRGGSHRYRRRRTDEPAVRAVTYDVELHPWSPRRSSAVDHLS
jgi:hypothetical protein